jgi:hypothetical protein
MSKERRLTAGLATARTVDLAERYLELAHLRRTVQEAERWHDTDHSGKNFIFRRLGGYHPAPCVATGAQVRPLLKRAAS